MITVKNAKVNGWHFESMKNGSGIGVCVKCGYVKEFKNEFNPKEHDCNEEGK